VCCAPAASAPALRLALVLEYDVRGVLGLSLSQQEALQLRPADAAAVKEGRESGSAEERKVVAEQDAVEAGQRPPDLLGVLADEPFQARMNSTREARASLHLVAVGGRAGQFNLRFQIQ